MLLKNNKGSALVVSLMITLVIGIIAATLANISYKGQKRENVFYSNEISYTNAMTGISRAVLFFEKVAGTDFPEVYISNDPTVPAVFADTVIDIDGVKVNIQKLKELYKGTDQELNNSIYLNFDQINENENMELWYRTDTGWSLSEACTNCVGVGVKDGKDEDYSTIYRIEKRDFSPLSPAVSSESSNIGYQFYRVTSRGKDLNSGAVTILQANIGVLSTRKK